MLPSIDRYSSFSYIARQIRAQRRLEIKEWHSKQIKKAYSHRELKLDPIVSEAKKSLAKRFYQLKLGHAITASYLYRIKRVDTPKCWWCTATNQDIDHLLFECRQWRKERRTLYSDLRRLGVYTPEKAKKAQGTGSLIPPGRLDLF